MVTDCKDATPRITLGIDPALGTTGYGLISYQPGQLTERPSVIDAGIVRCRKDQPLEQRLHELYCGIFDIISEYQPQDVALEQLYSHYQRPTTAILMGHARGAIMLAAANAGLKVCSYAATHVKKTLTGNGRASKSQMQFAVQHQLGLSQTPEPADVADALAIAVTHCQSTQMPHAFLDAIR